MNNVAASSGCNPGTGVFTGCYYSGQNFDTFVFSRTDAAIHFDWTGTGPQGPLALGPDNYSVRWLGNFQFPAGTVPFTIDTDDGSRLYVDGQLAYGNWSQQWSFTNRGECHPDGGHSPGRVRLFPGAGRGCRAALVGRLRSFAASAGVTVDRHRDAGQWSDA
ncbi:MAG: PA14 domain-containing protein [Ignavibacteriota bacterium]